MTDEPENLVLAMLRRIDERTDRTDAKVDRILDDLHDLKVRMTSVEEGLVGVNRRLDRLEMRIDRIETRFGLVEPAR